MTSDCTHIAKQSAAAHAALALAHFCLWTCFQSSKSPLCSSVRRTIPCLLRDCYTSSGCYHYCCLGLTRRLPGQSWPSSRQGALDPTLEPIPSSASALPGPEPAQQASRGQTVRACLRYPYPGYLSWRSTQATSDVVDAIGYSRDAQNAETQ